MAEGDERATGLVEDSRSNVEEASILVASGRADSEQLCAALESEGAQVDCVTSYEPAAAALEEESVDVVVVDRELVPDEGQRPIPGDFESRPVALLRVDEHTPTAYCRTVDLGFDTLVSADIGPESLLRLSEQELRARVAAGEGRGRLSAGPMYGESETMCEICRLIASAAPSSAAVLITGESGVGKELVSEAIHRLSPRRSQPFVAVDCGAIPENLIESELFGHEEGAFTGATSSRKGRFERADGGTLFLDEVGELPPNLQVKLLRVLEEQSFERVGGSEKISVDVRIVSATNRDLAVEIERDAFRRDLFFRLNVLQIDIPPLREHRRDIDPLWRRFVERAATKEARRVPETAAAVYRKLYRYDWPGNVRELRNVARHAVALAVEGELDVDHLPPRFREKLDDQFENRPDRVQVPGMTLEELERAAIIRTHDWTDDVSQTAQMLGVSERKVYYKLKEYRESGFLPLDDSGRCDDDDREEGGGASMPRLLIAEDDRQLQWTLAELLEEDYEIETVANGRQLVDEFDRFQPDLILCDLRMPGLDGIQVLRESQNRDWDVPIVLITAYGDDENREQAELLGATAFLDKPIDGDRLRQKLSEVLETD